MKEGKRNAVVSELLEWFRKHGRIYPWRRDTDSYRILIAEIMLQRTKADQVLGVYESFIREFPDPSSLAMAETEKIENAFARLGLRWRAGKIKRLAHALVSRYNGRIPDERKELLSLPGVGEYIADAVLCFAYGRDVAVVDANVCRIMERLAGLRPKGEARRDPDFRRAVQELVPKGMAREFNWALIDLAAMICTPKKPKCPECPLKEVCMYASQKK